MLEFAYPILFVLLPAPLIAWRLLPSYRERQASVRVPFLDDIAAATGSEPRRGGVVARRNVAQWLVAPVVWVCLITALARPQRVDPPIIRTESARDLMLAIDLSGSMDTRDMFNEAGERITRTEAAKTVIDAFVARRTGDRIGVVVFGSQAFINTPFTADHDLVRDLLAQLEAGMAGAQTMLGDGIGLTVRAFEASEAEDRVLVLLTDGTDTGSTVPPAKAAEIAANNDITVHTIAIGDTATMGANAIDTETLEQISEATGGASFLAGDREALEEVYRQIDALTPEEVETTSYRPTHPLFHWPLGIALGAMLLYHLLMGLRTGARHLVARDA
jgi:Ca-activated chloride channel family protein